MNAELLEAAKALPLPERIEFAEALWESINEDGHAHQITPGQAIELDRRLDDYRCRPDEGIPWTEVKAALERKYGNPS